MSTNEQTNTIQASDDETADEQSNGDQQDDGTWLCTICSEERQRDDAPYRFDNTAYCIDCIRSQIQIAIGAGTFPVRMGEAVIESIHPFEDELSEDLRDGYRELELMGPIPVPERIFCPHNLIVRETGEHVDLERCNKFVIRRSPFEEGAQHMWARCDRCGEEVCSRCTRGRDDSNEAARDGGLCTRTQAMDDEEIGLGMDPVARGWQSCPSCRRFVVRVDGCNEMICTCGVHFCYVCEGEYAGNSGHWGGQAGCPRWRGPEENNAMYDDPYYDIVNLDGRIDNFEALRETDTGLERDARTVRQAQETFRPPPRVQRAANPEHLHINRMLLSARHLTTMMNNGVRFLGLDFNEQLESVHRRIRFAHHGSLFRYHLNRLEQNVDRAPGVPGSILTDFHIGHDFNRLQFQRNAVPIQREQRPPEWRAFELIVNDQLDVQWPFQYAIAMNSIDQEEATRAVSMRGLLEPVRRMLEMINQRAAHMLNTFSLADSVLLRVQMQELQSHFNRLQTGNGGIAGFRQANSEQNAVYEIADLFLNHLLEDQRAEEVWHDLPDDEVTIRSMFSWATDISDAIRADGSLIGRDRRPFEPNQVDHRLLTELSGGLDHMLRALQDITDSDYDIRRVSDQHLGGLREMMEHLVRESLVRRREEPSISGQLRPLFFTLYQQAEAIWAANHDRLLSPPASQRSSLTSNADNNLANDDSFVAHTYVDRLERALDGAREVIDQLGREDPVSPRTTRMLNMLHPLAQMTRRLAERGRHPGTENQVIFDRMDDIQHQIRTRTGGFEDFRGQDPEGRIARVLDRIMPEARIRAEINPEGADRGQRMGVALGNLRNVSDRYDDYDERAQIFNLWNRWERDWELWGRGPGRGGGIAAERFVQFLIDLYDYAVILHVPPDTRSQRATARGAVLHERLLNYDVHNTPVGDLEEELPRVWAIWNVHLHGTPV